MNPTASNPSVDAFIKANPAPNSTPALPPPQSNTQPTIPTSTITDTKPLNIPDTPNNGAKPSQSILGITQGLNNGQAILQTKADQAQQTAQENYNSTGSSVTGLINNYLGKGQDQINAENAANIPQFKAVANDLTTQYQTKQLAYNNQYNEILNRVGGTASQKAQEISDLTQSHSYDLANTGILQAIAQNQYTTAQQLVDHQIDVKYAPMKDAITFGMQFLANNKDILTQAQQNKFQTDLSVQQQQYTEATYNDHLFKDTQVQMLKDAASNGAPTDVLQSIQNAQSVGEAAQAGGEYIKNGNYTPIQTGVSDNGLPIYSVFNPKTGNLDPMNPGNALGVTGNTDTVVDGVQLGATTTLGAYAQHDDGSVNMQQINNIKTANAQIKSAVGNITDSNTAQAAINTLNQKSPITGDMIMKASQMYPGVPIAPAIALMQAETQLGTDGSKGATMGNFGNVGNTNIAMKNGKPVAMNPQDGVNAVFKCISKRIVQEGQVDPVQPTTPNTQLTPLQQANKVIQTAPRLIQTTMNAIPSTGDAYIRRSALSAGGNGTPNTLAIANAYAQKNNIPILDDNQISELENFDAAAAGLNQVQNQFVDLAPTSFTGKTSDSITNLLSSFVGTDYGNKLNAYNGTVSAPGTSVFKTITGSGRMSQFANGITSTALPQLGKNPVNAGDTKDGGIDKINSLKGQLNTILHSIIPNSPGIPLTPTSSWISVKAPDGTLIKFPDQATASKFSATIKK